MVSEPPVSIQKEIKPFLSRANEVAIANPAIAYFCKLYCAQLILDKKLHQNSGEITAFVTGLLDDIEEMKSSGSQDLQELISDESKGLEYVKNFAFSIFENLNNQMETHNVTRSTATGFIAVLNFLQLLKLWDPQDEELTKEVAHRIKYAKFHAARILKAFKNGEDPNDYELPKPKNNNEDEEAIAKLEEQLKNEKVVGSEEVDKHDSYDDNSREDHVAVDNDDDDEEEEEEESSSIRSMTPPLSANQTINDSSNASFIDNDQALKEREAKKFLALQQGLSHAIPRPANDSFELEIKPKPALSSRSSLSRVSKPDVKTIMDETELISKAQKHAKYAISALNYEDKPTAILELRKALDLLEN
ncbi:Vta1 protein [Saccharomycopsis crataegensis]|uniref:Vta1 protein n=1 Tax=Saccharomycopsis crataegensis TaxID=43959 RepID=A0AAV5QGT3_9ASCO|nr:Vta1 protein [Saccharomycopsis crataegensis]